MKPETNANDVERDSQRDSAAEAPNGSASLGGLKGGKDSESSVLDRRKFLVAGAATVAAGAALTKPAEAQGMRRHIADHLAETARQQSGIDRFDEESIESDVFFEDFVEPKTVVPRLGAEVALDAAFATIFVAEPGRIRKIITRCYDQRLPGKTIRALPGETLKIHLRNLLPSNTDPSGQPCPPPGDDMNRPNCFNTTNLHTHGLHVSPNEPGDDIFIAIWPKGDTPWGHAQHKDGEFHYRIELPRDHAPGTHWYHSHRHGSTAAQVKNGMAGALIIDELPGQEIVTGVEELIMVLQEIRNEKELDTDIPEREERRAEKLDLPAGDPAGPGDANPNDNLISVNGRIQPILRMQPGEMQRWRIVNAGANVATYSNIEFGELGPTGYLVAWDGITLTGAPRKLEEPLLLAPGNRADLLVVAPNIPGVYDFRRTEYTSGNGPVTVPAQDLAKVWVFGEPHLSPPLPTKLPASQAPYLEPITDKDVEGTPKRTVIFAVNGGTAGGISAGYKDDQGIDYPPVPYDPNFSIQVPLGNVEEWTIENIASMDHPFHIHVNPFQIVEIQEDGEEPVRFSPQEARWADVVNVPHNGHVKIRSRFLDFMGKYVLHCHILNHEDRGMMLNVEVV